MSLKGFTACSVRGGTSERKHTFVALSKISEVLIFGIPAVYVLTITPVEPGSEPGFLFLIAAAAFITFLNYFFLSNAYDHDHGDLSLTYLISRSGTLFLPLIAFLLIDEVIDPTGWVAVGDRNDRVKALRKGTNACHAGVTIF